MRVGGQRHAPAALPPGRTRYPLYRGLGGPQGRAGRVRKISPHPIGVRTSDRPARNKSLYRLSCLVNPQIPCTCRSISVTLFFKSIKSNYLINVFHCVLILDGTCLCTSSRSPHVCISGRDGLGGGVCS